MDLTTEQIEAIGLGASALIGFLISLFANDESKLSKQPKAVGKMMSGLAGMFGKKK